MTTKTDTEQERAEFRALVESLPGAEQERQTFEEWCDMESMPTGRLESGEYINDDTWTSWQAWKARAALQSQPIESAAREIALWAYGEVGADPELTPGLAQLLHHFGITDDVPVALQSQDREDAERFRFCLEHGFPQKWEEMIKGNLRHYWTSRPGSQEEFSSAIEAIDHARRIEENK